MGPETESIIVPSDDEASLASTDEDAQVHAVIEAYKQALRGKDVDAMLAVCTDDLSVFDLVPPLAHEGASALRGVWGSVVAAFEGPLEYDLERVALVVGRDVGYAHGLARLGGTRKEGGRVVHWMACTLGLKKIDGRWKIAHQHTSVPFDMDTGKAMLDLTPPHTLD